MTNPYQGLWQGVNNGDHKMYKHQRDPYTPPRPPLIVEPASTPPSHCLNPTSNPARPIGGGQKIQQEEGGLTKPNVCLYMKCDRAGKLIARTIVVGSGTPVIAADTDQSTHP